MRFTASKVTKGVSSAVTLRTDPSTRTKQLAQRTPDDPQIGDEAG